MLPNILKPSRGHEKFSPWQTANIMHLAKKYEKENAKKKKEKEILFALEWPPEPLFKLRMISVFALSSDDGQIKA